MRAARLLHMLLLLQNRGRLTAQQLSKELEVTRRTVLRDVDALTEAGLPIVVVRGNQGGMELGFNYRTRLTGLAADEAKALAILLMQPQDVLACLGKAEAGARAVAKLIESFPDRVRETMTEARRNYRFSSAGARDADSRIAALAQAVQDKRIVTLRATSPTRQTIHPIALGLSDGGWYVVDGHAADQGIPLTEWGDINISARQFSSVATVP